ncbi:unnamed protein product, partial [Didymodactylos carnosus]
MTTKKANNQTGSPNNKNDNNQNGDNHISVDIPEGGITTVTVEGLYDKEKYDLSTMEQHDIFKLL